MTEMVEFMEAIFFTMSRFIIWIPQHLGFLLDIAIGYLFILVCFKVAKVVGLLFLGPSSPSTKLFIATAKSAGPPNGMSKEAWISQELTKLPDIIAKAELEAEHEWRIENGEHEGCPKCKPKKEFGVPARLREPEPQGITERNNKLLSTYQIPAWMQRESEPAGITDRFMRTEWSEDGKSVTFKRIPLRADPPTSTLVHRRGKISLDMHGNRYCETCGALTPNWQGDYHNCIR